jgi:hypothetical protein
MNKKVAPEHDNQVDSYVDLTEEVHNHHFIITRSFFCLSVDITLYAFLYRL